MNGHDSWTTSGARALTGHAHKPGLDPPDGLVDRLDALAATWSNASTHSVDPFGLITERACFTGATRGGQTSCNGATRLLRARDDWIAVSFTRPDDWALVPAWLCSEFSGENSDSATRWKQIARAVAQQDAASLEAQGALVGLAIGRLASWQPTQSHHAFTGLPVHATRLGDAAPSEVTNQRVIDASALWAGPLCGRLLAHAGALVTKVESRQRPDAARFGHRAFFDALNAMKKHVVVDLSAPHAFKSMLSRADIVIESSRPRALAQLGISAQDMVATGPRVWVSITGHGRTGDNALRIGFGDDAAVAGGLVAFDESGQPVFCGDAIADPMSGLVAAAAVAHACQLGGRWLIDVPLAGVAASLSTR